jgi:hypothetical protein
MGRVASHRRRRSSGRLNEASLRPAIRFAALYPCRHPPGRFPLCRSQSADPGSGSGSKRSTHRTPPRQSHPPGNSRARAALGRTDRRLDGSQADSPDGTKQVGRSFLTSRLLVCSPPFRGGHHEQPAEVEPMAAYSASSSVEDGIERAPLSEDFGRARTRPRPIRSRDRRDAGCDAPKCSQLGQTLCTRLRPVGLGRRGSIRPSSSPRGGRG